MYVPYKTEYVINLSSEGNIVVQKFYSFLPTHSYILYFIVQYRRRTCNIARTFYNFIAPLFLFIFLDRQLKNLQTNSVIGYILLPSLSAPPQEWA